MFSGFDNEKKESGTTGGETKPTKDGNDKKALRSKDGYIAKILADELKDPPLSTQRKILKELGIGENDGI